MFFLQRNLSACPKDFKATYQVQHQQAGSCPTPRSKIICHSDYKRTSFVTSMMEDLGWEQLEAGSQQAIMLYRIVNQLVNLKAASLLIPTDPSRYPYQRTRQQIPCTILLCQRLQVILLPVQYVFGKACQLSSSQRLP